MRILGNFWWSILHIILPLATNLHQSSSHKILSFHTQHWDLEGTVLAPKLWINNPTSTFCTSSSYYEKYECKDKYFPYSNHTWKDVLIFHIPGVWWFASCAKCYMLTPLHAISGDDTKEVSTACINEAMALGENYESVVQKRVGFYTEWNLLKQFGLYSYDWFWT